MLFPMMHLGRRLLFLPRFGLLRLAFTLVWVLALVSVIRNKGLADGEKAGWVITIVFLPFIGGLLYMLFGHPKRLNPRTVIDA
jgi:Phospholipase_D-nuclease N-terminal